MAIEKPDPILLTLFANRFMSVAEAAGRSLQLTSILFAPNGDLIANAPHLPVHLGSMSFAVRYQVATLGVGADSPSGDGIVDGDVLLTNSPTAGGSHLPDLTTITPVFDAEKKNIIFFTASRGHHADIGGCSAGSMSPNATTIFQEGARIETFKIVRQGKYDRDGLYERLVTEPASYPGSSGSRCFRDVDSDLQAQIAANHRAVTLLYGLIDEYGLETVQRYMGFIRDNAEFAVRNLLRKAAQRAGKNVLHAIDHMDDGSPIELTITIDEETGSAVFDFEGTGPETWSSLNAPMAVCSSAVIYCLRILCDEEIPLNAGCLAPIELKIPKGTILNPSETCAVVGGNVTTSQRVTDTVLRCFEAVAASQGDCNNFTFGTENFGYCDGAGPSWHGESGIHCHMTNTRITDVETLERRYPCLLHEFSIREGSGGKGKFKGGDGVVRDVETTIPIEASILSERRVNRPYGLKGGEPGERGKNLWIKQRRKEDGDWKADDSSPRVINLGPRSTIKMGRGDRFVIHTPGAGGWGDDQWQDENVAPNTSKAASKLTLVGLAGSLAERAAAQLTTCTLYHDTCTFSIETDGRKPASKSYVTALEERVKVLEAILTQGGVSDDATTLQDTVDGVGDGTGLEEGAQADLGLDRLKLDEETLEFTNYGPTSAFQHLPEPLASPNNDDSRALSQSPGAPPSAQTNSSFRRRASTLTAASPPLPSYRSATSPLNGPLDWQRNLPPAIAQKWDADLHEHLLVRFFRYFNGWCHWVEEAAFRHDLTVCLTLDPSHPTPPVRTSAYSPLLHNALLSLACSLSDDQRLRDRADAKELSGRAKSLVEDEGERPMLSTLQGLLLLGSYHSGNGLQGLGYLYSGIAFRMSHTLGLGIDASAYVSRGLLTEETRNARDRVMWCAYVQDKLWSSYVGRNPSILRNIIEIALPVVDVDRDKELWSPLPIAGDSLTKPLSGQLSSTFHWTCRLAVIEEKILVLVYALRVQLYSAQVLNRVSELHLPVDLRIAPQTSKPPPPHVCMLNCMYQFCIILLHRPYYVRHNSPNVPINDSAIKRCNSAATRIVALFELYQRSPGLRYAPISATQIAFAAATTHLLALVNADAAGQKKRAMDAREATRSCGRILRGMGKAWPCAVQTADIFDGLIQKWMPEQPGEESASDAGPAGVTAPAPADPLQSAAVQALDPHSDLAKELLRLGWTPPIQSGSAQQAEASALLPAPLILPNPPLSACSQAAQPFATAYNAFPSPPPFSTALPAHAPFPASLASSPSSNPFDRFGSWPFFAAPSFSNSTAPTHQPLADDVFAGLLSTEGRGAGEAVYGGGTEVDYSTFFGQPAFGVSQGPSGWSAFGTGAGQQ
ncbi:cytoplasmic protein [Rhodotorula toruloides]|uniref:Cytoplasmic protein n=1 Tax=Rhodotorula toruloides TaxID=5286 RepID=A0A511KK69_RHOTO|nr:cytoplasmic protein [Rhodotorula toruloides]